MTRFLESSKDTIITSTDKEHTILKKYEMQRFASQSETDKVISDFAKLVKDNTGVKFFKENFIEVMSYEEVTLINLHKINSELC